MWEDEFNKKGGRWLINLNKAQRLTDLDNFWLETVIGALFYDLFPLMTGHFDQVSVIA